MKSQHPTSQSAEIDAAYAEATRGALAGAAKVVLQKPSENSPFPIVRYSLPLPFSWLLSYRWSLVVQPRNVD